MKTLIKNALLVNEGKIVSADVLLHQGLIERIDSDITAPVAQIIDAKGLHMLPGAIDDQVHFREPGLTWKGDIHSESGAAVAGGITSFMEMPNTVPPALTHDLLNHKYEIAQRSSYANYSFFMGASNDNIEEIKRVNPKNVCGVKVFMGSSTGNLLVDDNEALEQIFKHAPTLVATHCEDEQVIRDNTNRFKSNLGDNTNASDHPKIRTEEACYLSSSKAVALAKKHHTRLHILHISTAKELELFSNELPLSQKRITAEACIHHLWFSDHDYARLGNRIKWNPAIKTVHDQHAILEAVIDSRIDIIATDHAPHTIEEKDQHYFLAPSGGPLVQHGLLAMLELMHRGKISLEKVVEKMSHAPAQCFQVAKRGFIREGYYADLVLVDLHKSQTVTKESLLYKCGWSPFEGETFRSSVIKTFVSGHLVYDQGLIKDSKHGMRLMFER